MILVVGSANVDRVVRAPRIPAPGETVLGRSTATFVGGKGVNQAIACARAGGAATTMVLAVGDDGHGGAIEEALRLAGVAAHVVRVAGEATGTAFICVSDDGENAITVAPGANAHLAAAHLPPLAGVSHVVLQLEIPVEAVVECARAARAAGALVVLNAAPARELPGELLALVDILIVNQGELETVAGQGDDTAACLARIDVPCVVVTLGAAGCCARQHGEIVRQQAFPVSAIDTTAAGDTFCGVLVAALGRGDGLQEALRRASAAAALTCTRVGAAASIPSAAEVDVFLRRAL